MADSSDKATEERRQRNQDILAPLSDSDANGRFFLARAEQRMEIIRLLNTLLRQEKADVERNKTKLELLCDDWQFHRGPADTPEKKERMYQDIFARLRQQIAARQRQRNANEYLDAMGLMEGFEDGEFGDLPSDGDVADALCKVNPELKNHRKNLI